MKIGDMVIKQRGHELFVAIVVSEDEYIVRKCFVRNQSVSDALEGIEDANVLCRKKGQAQFPEMVKLGFVYERSRRGC